MRVRLLIVTALCLLLAPVKTIAQPEAEERAEVMLDEARKLSSEGESEDAERLLRLIQRRYPNTEAARMAVDLLERMRVTQEVGNGNTELIVFNTFYGASLGILIPAAFDANEPEPYGAGLLLGAPIGYGASRLYTHRNPVTTGQARAMTFGTWWGALQGLGWREVFDIGDDTRTFCYGFGEDRGCYQAYTTAEGAPEVATIVGGMAGLATGSILARSLRISGSTALITNFAAIWGGWYGAVLGVQLDTQNRNDFSDEDDDAVLATMLAGGNVGLIAGALAGPSLGWSSADAWIVHLAGITGLIGGLGIDLLASVESTETGLLIPGLTSAAALGIAGAIVSRRNSMETRSAIPGQSLLNYASGQWVLGAPVPTPTRTPIYRNGERHLELGARISLLRMEW